MYDLCKALEKFDRKERNLLIRTALQPSHSPVSLHPEFLERITKKLNLQDSKLDKVWWAIDYHFAWLAGALAVYAKGDKVVGKVQTNHGQDDRRLVEGNQEDVDLVIAFERQLILIEAKGYGAHSNCQLRSKLQRLNLLHTFYQQLQVSEQQSIRFHFLLTSPRPPQKLICEGPAWARKGDGIPWIEMPLNPAVSVLTVTRCDCVGKSTAAGDHWCIMR